MKELSVGAQCAWMIAMGEAKTGGHQYVEKEHILIGIYNLEKVSLGILGAMPDSQRQALEAEYRTLKDVLQKAGIDLTQLRHKVRKKLPKGTCVHKEDEVVHRSNKCKEEVFVRADELAVNAEVTTCIHLLAAILENPGDTIHKALEEAGMENLSNLQEKVIASAANKKEEREDTDNKKEPIIMKLEELIKVDKELINILKENIGKEQKIAHTLNLGGVSTPKRGYREYIREVINELEEIMAGLAKGLKFQAAMAVVEGVFVLYYSLGVWHFIIPEKNGTKYHQ